MMIEYSRCSWIIKFIVEDDPNMYDKVTQYESRLIIGTKQTLKAIRNGEVEQVIVAKDADEHITNSVIQEAEKHDVPYEYVDSKAKLGEACKIDVAASTV